MSTEIVKEVQLRLPFIDEDAKHDLVENQEYLDNVASANQFLMTFFMQQINAFITNNADSMPISALHTISIASLSKIVGLMVGSNDITGEHQYRQLMSSFYSQGILEGTKYGFSLLPPIGNA